ncbi:nucleotidyltransferase [Geobacillus stearothermophilus]|uniref:nucleotidyltransferase n=1 Tax=Geobacillus stearothermophilus TaxID=1422 RepID=UPI0018752894|nr:nucleotidyltransferase [Geobacillus stearothermophilus]WJQ13010.1 nucleotidyltransferase [Geobacillus stearothermophilus]
MKAVGVIVEYNPFHNGHRYHLQETREKTGADCLVAVMSGNFLQRGEPAIVSKWARAKMALAAGVDLVIELPYAFAVQAAERFADGAVRLLDALGCEELCFGSESGDIAAFLAAAKTLFAQKEEFDALVRAELQRGQSFPKANAKAWDQLRSVPLDLAQPNNVLGLAYVKAIWRHKLSIMPRTIPRLAAGYHDESFSHPSIASATSVRKTLRQTGQLASIAPYVPPTTLEQLRQYRQTYGRWHDWEAYFPLLKYRLLTATKEELRRTAGIEEGVEHRLKEKITVAETFASFIAAVKTKRYTWTRLQRMCAHVLTNFTKEEQMKTSDPTYIRLLGMSETGRRYLQRVKKELALPLITKAAKLNGDPLYEQEKRAAAVYAAALPEPLYSAALKEEYATTPIYASGMERK